MSGMRKEAAVRSGRPAGGISGTGLKMIALFCMTLDHFAAMALSYGSGPYIILRTIGRQAFPIFCFLIAEGDAHTGNRLRYLGRLFLFAVISELPFDLAFSASLWDPRSQNVFFTLFLGELALSLLACLRGLYRRQQAEGRQLPGGQMLCVFFPGVLAVLALVSAADRLGTDYGGSGVLLIVLLSLVRGRGFRQLLAAALVMGFVWSGNQLQMTALLAFVILLPLYNGRRGTLLFPILCYFYYPLHLIVLRGILWFLP